MFNGVRNFFSASRHAISAFSHFYDAAAPQSQERTYIWPIAADSKDTQDAWTRTQLLGLSRNLYANVGFVKGAVDDISRYSIGTGISPVSLIPDDMVAKEHDDYFTAWAQSCEVTGKFTFPHLCRLLSRAVDVDGDIGIIFSEEDSTAKNGVLLPKLQVVEGHRITDPTGNSNWYDGVKVDPLGRPLAYRVLIDEKRYTDIEAPSFYLLLDPDRCDAFRGVSALKHAINNIRDKKDIMAFEKLGVKNASAIAMVITAQLGGQGGTGFFAQPTQAGTGTNQITTEKLRGGAIPRLNPGEKLESFASSRPSPTFTGFLSYIDRDVASGLGVPIEFVWDSSNLAGTAQRFILEKAQRRFAERQDVFIPFVAKVRRYVIARGIARKEIAPHTDWEKMGFQRPAKITVDVGREATANRDDVRAGLRTIQEDYGERGVHWRNTRQENQSAAEDLLTRAVAMVEKYKAHNLTLDAALRLLEDRSSPPIVVAPQPEPKPATEKPE